ncbi:MAG: hypothetical protein HFH57_15865 [Lachnospiraceae bacterium]|jgi:hypothetical protein|nr:hypothetical protein [Lachnospiraceae bacterium]
MKKITVVLALLAFAAACVGIGVKVSRSGGSKDKTNVTILQTDYPEYDTASELAEAADLIFQGTVSNVKYQMLDVRTEKEKDQDAGLSETEAIPYTLYTIDVEKVYKGPLKEPTITIKRPGGKFENNEYITENAPEILTGRDYLFIAESYENSYPSLLNPTQSAYDMGASQDAEKKKKTDITAADILALFGSFE